MQNTKIYKNAFTLAEVLIVLGIIGLIADMIIPTLIQNTQEKIATAKLKKAYSTFEQAFRLIVADKGTPDNWGLAYGQDNRILEIFQPYLKITKYCQNGQGCWPDVMYKFLNGNDFININTYGTYDKAQLADGTLLQAFIHSSNCSEDFGNSPALKNGCGEIRVDIDGFKGKHTEGVDTFLFLITKYGIIPNGTEASNHHFEEYCNRTSTKTYNGDSCTAWVIYNENMDYLHCDDLSWSGKKSCKDNP